MILVPFIPAHLDDFELQPEQDIMNKYLKTPEYVDQLTQMSDSYTGLVDGKAVFLAGMINVHEHIGMSWALLSVDAKKHLFAITRAISRWLDEQDTPRIETTVKRGFKEGHRWVKMLGFENETPEKGMKNYGLDGETYDLYSRGK